jgi:hypothetical protein
MPVLAYRITEALSAIVIDLPIGTNLGLLYILWTRLSGRLLQNRGALIPALAATGLEPAGVRRAWAAFAGGAWDVSHLISALQALVRHEGRWHAQHCGGYRVRAVYTTGFFRPRLKNCATKHYVSQAGEVARDSVWADTLPHPQGAGRQRRPCRNPDGADRASGRAGPQCHGDRSRSGYHPVRRRAAGARCRIHDLDRFRQHHFLCCLGWLLSWGGRFHTTC